MTTAIKSFWSALPSGRKRMVKISAGLLLGSLAGYTYYALIGCSTGSCAITSNPWISTFWGGLIGATATA